jgi:hypothetical protein
MTVIISSSETGKPLEMKIVLGEISTYWSRQKQLNDETPLKIFWI